MSTLALANAIVLLAAFVQAGTGIGFAMIAVPLLALVDLALVPGPALAAMVVLSALMARRGRGDIEVRDFRALLPGLVAGSVLGAVVLRLLPAEHLGTTVGAVILVAVAVTASGVHARITPVNLLAGGTAAGLMGTIAAIHGPPLAILYAGAPLARARAMIAVTFVIAALLSLGFLAAAGRFDWNGLLNGLALLPGVLAGFAIAQRAIGRIPARWLRAAMLALAGASGALLVGRG